MLNDPADPLDSASQDQAIAIASAMAVGAFPGEGSAQIDTFPEEDNVDPGHPLNVDYYIASNFQRLLGARLSFKLRAYRTYATLVTTTGNTFLQLGALLIFGCLNVDAVSRHSNTGGTDSYLSNATLVACCGTNVLATPVTRLAGIDASLAGGTPNIATVIGSQGAALVTALTGASNSLGVVEDLTATGVTVTIDGTDVTSQLTPAGPYNTDQVELDLRPVMTASRITPKAFHTIALASTQRGRIHAFLKLQYFVNGQIG